MNYSHLWSDLPRELSQEFDKKAIQKLLKRGEFVYHVTDQPHGLYFVEEGLVGLTLVGPSGKDHLLRFFKPQQFFGHRSLFAEEPYHGSAIALEKTKLLFLPKSVVHQALEDHPRLYLDILRVLAKELRRVELQHVRIVENQILSRVAQSLVYLKDMRSDHLWTRQEIATFCGSTPSTVIKALASLESRKLIQQVNRRIDILDRKGLIDLPTEENID